MSPALSVDPAGAGLSAERLGRIRTKMKKHIEGSRLAEGLGLIMRRNTIGFFETWGMGDKETSAPMSEDAIFRIFSMTKAITGAGRHMLFEEGSFVLSDPITNFMPEFRDMRVAVELADPATGKIVLTTTVPAARPITVPRPDASHSWIQLHWTAR